MGAATFNRRSFLKGALMAGAGVASGAMLSGCAPQSASDAAGSGSDGAAPMTADAYEKLTWSFEVPPEPVDESQITQTIADDFIVIGSGVSGLVAAASILGHGGSCTLFSAGTKAVSRGGSNHAVGTKTQKRLGLHA